MRVRPGATAAQAKDLVAPAPELTRQVAAVEMEPCWAGLFLFEDAPGPAFDGAFVEGDVIAWVARLPQATGESWIVHADLEWAPARLEQAAELTLPELRGDLARVIGRPVPAARYERARLWRYARPSAPLGEACLFDPELRIGACGEWCVGARVEAAWLGGIAMAARCRRS